MVTRRGPKFHANDIIVKPNGTTIIMLTQGQKAIIDTIDYPKVIKYRWFALKQRNTFYAYTNTSRLAIKKRTTLKMHHIILPLKQGRIVDHISGNGLDNRKLNLRYVTPTQNSCNHTLRTDNKIGYSGVSWHERDKKWQAQIQVDGKVKHLGQSHCFKKALKMRHIAEIQNFGEYVRNI